MKKSVKILIVMVLAACLIWINPGMAKAQEFNKKWGIGALVAMYNTSSSDMGNLDTTFDTATVFGGSVIYFINKSFSLELSSQYQTTDLKLEFDDKSGTLGEIQQIPILLTARYQHAIQKTNANIYLGLGGGYFINDFSQEKRTDLSDFFGVNVDAEINSSIGWHANVGTEMFFKEHYSVYLDLKVIFTDAEFDLTYPDATRESRDVALNASVLAIGFNYYF